MRQRKSLRGPSAGYSRQAKPSGEINGPMIDARTQCLPASRSSDNDVTREMRQQQVHDLLQATEGDEPTIVKEIIQDIRVEGRPEETELILLNVSGHSRPSTHTTVDDVGATVATVPASKTEVEERSPSENAESRENDEDERENDGSVENPTQSEQTNRQSQLTKTAQFYVYLKGIMETTCDGYGVSCKPEDPSSISSPCETTMTPKDANESLKKSVSWRDDVIESPKKNRDQLLEALYLPALVTHNQTVELDAQDHSYSSALPATSSIQSEVGIDVVSTSKVHEKRRNNGFVFFSGLSKPRPTPKQEKERMRRDMEPKQSFSTDDRFSFGTPGDVTKRPYTSILPLEGVYCDKEVDISDEARKKNIASKGRFIIEAQLDPLNDGCSGPGQSMDFTHVPQSDRESAPPSKSTAINACGGLQKTSLIQKEIIELRKDLDDLRNSMMLEIGRDLESILTCTQRRYNCSNRLDDQYPDDLAPLAHRMDTLDEWTVTSMRAMSGSEGASMDDSDSVIPSRL